IPPGRSPGRRPRRCSGRRRPASASRPCPPAPSAAQPRTARREPPRRRAEKVVASSSGPFLTPWVLAPEAKVAGAANESLTHASRRSGRRLGLPRPRGGQHAACGVERLNREVRRLRLRLDRRLEALPCDGDERSQLQPLLPREDAPPPHLRGAVPARIDGRAVVVR